MISAKVFHNLLLPIIRVIIKRLLKKYKYPPDATEAAVKLIMEQAKQMCENEA